MPVEDHEQRWNEIDDATRSCSAHRPTWLAPSAPFKSFLDATSGRWQEQRWKNKLAAGFTNSAGLNGDKLATLQQLALFAMQHSMIWVGLGLLPGNHTGGLARRPQRSPTSLMAQSNADQGPELVLPWPIVEPPSTWAAESPRRPNAGTTSAALPPKAIA